MTDDRSPRLIAAVNMKAFMEGGRGEAECLDYVTETAYLAFKMMIPAETANGQRITADSVADLVGSRLVRRLLDGYIAGDVQSADRVKVKDDGSDQRGDRRGREPGHRHTVEDHRIVQRQVPGR